MYIHEYFSQLCNACTYVYVRTYVHTHACQCMYVCTYIHHMKLVSSVSALKVNSTWHREQPRITVPQEGALDTLPAQLGQNVNIHSMDRVLKHQLSSVCLEAQ